MRTLVIVVLAIALTAAPLLAGGKELRQIERLFELDGRTVVRIDLPVAELTVIGSPGERIEVEMTAICKRDRDCKGVLEALDLVSHASRNTVRIDLVGYPKWGKGRIELEVEARVPRALEVEVEMGVGELELRELTGDVRAELGVGEINAWLPRSAVRSVTLDAGVGEVELYGANERVEGRRSMLIGSEVHWDDGEGTKRTFLEVGVGEISVWLE